MIFLQIFINILVTASYYILVSLSFVIIYNCTKFFHLAHSAIITLGAYFTFFFVTQIGLPLPIAIILSIIVAASIGVACELFLYKPLRKKNVSSWQYLVASIGLYVILQNLISIYFGDDTKVISSGGIMVGHMIFGAYLTTIQIITIVVSISLFIVVNLFLEITTTGKAIKAVANNSELSKIYGINSDKIILMVFAIGSMLAAIAGILLAMDTNMTPTFGFNILLYGVIVMIISGVGGTKALIAGSFLVAISQHAAAYYINTKWMDAIAFIILLSFLIWKPLGISGMIIKKIEV